MEDEVQVVTAIIMQGDRIFMQQRSAHRELPFFWESPGGKVEPGENPREALSRELHEELGVSIPPSAFNEIQTIHVSDPRLKSRCAITFFAYLAGHNFEPKCLDAMGMGWFTIEDILRFRELAPGNQQYFARWGVSQVETMAIALADFHAATAESEGTLSRSSKRSKERFYEICKRALGMLEDRTPGAHLKRNYSTQREVVIDRLRKAMAELGVTDE